NTFLQDGTYTITVTVAGNGGLATASSVLQVRPGAPPAHLTDVSSTLTHADEYYANIIILPAYQHYLGRTPSSFEVNSIWLGLIHSGWTDERVKAGFIGSLEYYNHVGGTDQRWVDAMYQDLLGRAPDPAGESGWVGALASGASRSAVAYGFAA